MDNNIPSSSAENPGKTVFIDEQGRELYIEDPIYYDDDGNAILYSYQDLSQEIYHEEVVEEEPAPSTSTAPPAPNPIKNLRLIKDSCPASTLLTNQVFEAENATFEAKSGKKPTKSVEKAAKINRNGSELNKNVAGMTNLFKIMKQSVMRKTDEMLKQETLIKDDKEDNGDGESSSSEDPEDILDEPPPMEKLGMESSEFSDAIFDQWPLYSNKAIDFKEACELLVGVQEIDVEKVCKTIPLQFKHEGTFIIDIRNVIDMNNDQNGAWDTPSGKTRFYKETEAGDLVRADDGKGHLKGWTKDFTFKIMLKRYENQHTREVDEDRGHFQKKIYTCLKIAQRLPFAIITYSWHSGRPWNFVPPISSNKRARKTNWEKRAQNKDNLDNMPQMVSSYFEGFSIYSPFVVNFDEATAIMFGATPVDSNKICSSVPLGYRLTGTFVIDLKRMGHCLLELRRDDNGMWLKPSGFSRFYKFAENGDAMRVDKAGKLRAGEDYDVKVMSKRYEHPQVDKKFVRKIYTAVGKNSDSFPGSPGFAVIVYYWKGDPIPFEPAYKQNLVHTEQKEFARYQQIADDEQEFVEASGTLEEPVPEQQIVLEKEIITEGPPRLKRARFSTEHPHQENLSEMKMTLIRREMENQDRFSAVLDRAENLLDRMERNIGASFGNVYNPDWNHPEQIIEEEVIGEYE